MSRHAYGDGWNFWVVKYLRQMRHDFALPVAVIILLVIEFIIFRSFLGQRHYSPQWPWCLIFMSVLCGVGTTLCVAIGFAGTSFSIGGMRPGLSHFMDFSPMDANALFRGFVLSHLLTFGVLAGICLPIWLTGCYFFPERALTILAWIFDAYFLTLFLLQLDSLRWARADLMVALSTLPVMLFDRIHTFSDWTTVLLFGILAAWQLLNFRESLCPAAGVQECRMRFGQLVLLLAGWGMLFAPFRVRVPLLIGMAAAGALASMGGALNRIPQRQLEQLPSPAWRRFGAFLAYGSSAGGGFWCWGVALAAWLLLPEFDSPYFWRFLVSWGLAWAEVGFLIVGWAARRSHRNVSALLYHISIPFGLFVVAAAVAVISVATGSSGEAVFRDAAMAGWAAAALLFLPQIPRIVRDFRCFMGRRCD